MSNQLPTLSPIVLIQDGKVITSSIDVANYFGKLHKDIIRKIQTIECSEEFNERNFTPVGYLDSKGEKRPAYQMTKDGFIFLIMGFTGKKAAQFKEAYIKAFNEMEKALVKGTTEQQIFHTLKLTDDDWYDIAWVFKACLKMVTKLDEVTPSLYAMRSDYVTSVATMAHEYRKTVNQALPILARETQHINAYSSRWQNVLPELINI